MPVLVVIETCYIIHFVVLTLFFPFFQITKRQVNKRLQFIINTDFFLYFFFWHRLPVNVVLKKVNADGINLLSY